jgi:homoserine dehydrogenase
VSGLRVWIVGFGTVGRWVAGALRAQGPQLASRYGADVTVVGIGNARDGFAYHPDGLNLGAVLAAASGGRPITEQPGARAWPTAIDGLRGTEADLLVEVTGSPPAAGEPGLTHMREALRRGIPVVTSNKWPVALHGLELAELARERGVAFRAESTVMSGTPVLSALTEGLAGAVPVALRGLLNATANQILSQMAGGTSYEEALAAAQRAGLAERDPAADVEGHDTVAKLMILSALVFGRQLRRDQVTCQGITGISGRQATDAAAAGGRLRHVAALAFAEPGGRGTVTAGVRPEALPASDPLARIDGTANALVFQASPVGRVIISGPGAGTQLAGQGVLADIIAVARRPARRPLPGIRVITAAFTKPGIRYRR